MNAGRDFADWLSPMLVKELRQGMRSRLFVISFLLLQAAMIFVAIIGLSMSAKQGDTRAMTALFWTIIGAPLVFIMPMSGLNAVGNERKANTLELIFLTRLSARRIVMGKWLALVAQTILLVCAVLPYAVLRYFLGGVNLGAELTIIAVLLFGSAILSGFAVGFSPQSSPLTRALIAVGIFVGLQVFPSLLFGFGMGGGPLRSSPSMNWQTYVCLAWIGLLCLLLMLEFGASKIAPTAENHATPRRLIGLIVLCGVAIFGRRDLLSSPLWVFSVLLLGPICIGALCEPPSFVPSIYHPFIRFGRWGKLAGRLLYPGWPSGVLFSMVPLAVMFAVAYSQSRGAVGEKWILWAGLAAAGALYFPAAFLRIFLPRSRHPFVAYLGIQTILALLVVLAASLEASNSTDFRPALAMIPTCGLLLSGSHVLDDGNILGVLIGTSLITAASLFFLLFTMRQPWREIRTLEKTAAILPLASTIDAPERATTK